MDKKEAQKRINKLRETINYHRHLYHVEDRQEISDNALDSLKEELFKLEEKYPNLITKDSPTQRVGGKPLDKFRKVRHEKLMLSFNDGFSEEDIKKWFNRVENYLGKDIDEEFYCELKIDGFAIELVYEAGVLVQGSTRGDGRVGEDVTHNIKTIDAVPLSLASKKLPKRLVVRGEVFLTKSEFKSINEKLEKKYANPRNLAAGTIRQLDPKIAHKRKLDSYIYDIVDGGEYKTHEEVHKILKDWGFKTNPHNKKVKTLTQVFKLRDKWDKEKDKLPYEVDGLVIIINDSSVYQDAGVVGKAPRGAIAYKFSAKEATSVVEDIIVQVGRTGTLTPVARLKPVSIGGVTVQNSTLHNYDEIKRLDVRIGDTVVITRSGDVIPKITMVLKEMRKGDEKVFKMPSVCPVDGEKVVRDGVYYRCSNKNCGAILRKSLEHFVSRGAFNIEGLGSKIIDRFINEGLIKNAADIFKLKEADISVLDQFGNKSAENIIKEIETKKEIRLPRFIYSLGILNVGEETALELSKLLELKKMTPVKILNKFAGLRVGDLEKLPDIGPKVSKIIYSWFRDDRNKRLLKELDDVGVTITSPSRLSSNKKLKNLSFVLTGTLESMSRERAKELVRSYGGNFNSSVSEHTDFVVAGKNPGSKLSSARNLGVKILNEEEFLKMIS